MSTSGLAPGGEGTRKGPLNVSKLSEETSSSSQMSLFLRKTQRQTSQRWIPQGRKVFQMDSCPLKGVGAQRSI
ncbi:hypothetical protein GH733_015261, partial [Mirounga leonina]